MNEQTRPTGTAVAVQLPSDARELMALAKDVANSRLIPQHFQKSPADCWMLMAFCRDKGLNFFATVGHCHVVQNRLFFDGQLCAALLNISGFLADRLSYDYVRDGNGIATAVVVSARLRSEATPRTVTVELAKAKTANKVWETQPEQQLCYSGARIWGRRHLPEVLLGMTFEGETIDLKPDEIIIHNAGEAKVLRESEPKPPTFKPFADEPEQTTHKPSAAATAEASEPFEITRGDDSDATWSTWAQLLMAYVRACPTVDLINEWITANAEHLAALQKYDSTKYRKLVDAVNRQMETRAADHVP